MLLDATRFVDQTLEDSAHGVRVERLRGLTAQPIEHFPLSLGVVHGDAVSTLVLADHEHDTHPFSDQFEDAAIQIVDASPQRFELGSRLHGRERNTRGRPTKGSVQRVPLTVVLHAGDFDFRHWVRDLRLGGFGVLR